MHALSIRSKVTIWYTMLVALLAFMAIVSVAMVRNRVSLGYYRQSLESTASLALDDIYYDEGDIVIDRNLDELPNVSVAIYDLSGNLIYGKTRFDAEFDQTHMRNVIDRTGISWYVKDTLISPEGGASVWLRLYIASDASDAMNSSSLTLMLAISPLIVLLAAIGGWLITRAAFKPVLQIAATAEGIVDGRDLKKRIELMGAHDEIYRLAAVIDKMLERLDASFERESRFTSDAAHELRTPIAAIMAQSQSAIDAGEDEKRAALEDIADRAKDMSALVSELLTLTRMDAGRAAIEMEEVDVAELCEFVAEITGGVACVTSQGSCSLLCDQSMIMRVVINLVENAQKYAGEGAQINVEVIGEPEKVAIIVRDDGPGIAKDDIEHIFERFYQGDRARSGKGVGLGLSMVKQIAALHGGSVAVKNDGGAVFTVKLPRREGEQ